MSFAIQSAETRLQRMMVWYAGIQRRVTDFVVGSKIRTKFEAVAVELEQQDLAFFQALMKAIPVEIYNAFGFGVLPASATTGQVTFGRSTPALTDIVVPLGTQVATEATSLEGERVYATTESVTLLSGETSVDAPVACTTAGVFGRAATGAVSVLKTPISGIETVTNATAFVTGDDQETEAARRLRFEAYVAGLTRATKAGLTYGAKQAYLANPAGLVTERVAEALVFDPEAAPWGLVNVWIYNGAGYSISGGASDDLVTRAQAILDGYVDASGVAVPGYKAAGIVVTVLPVDTKKLDVSGSIVVSAGSDKPAVKAAADAALTAYLSSLAIGQSAVHAELIQRIMDLDGVVNVSLSEPLADMAATAAYGGCEVIVPGDFSGLTVA